jgi:lysophospholipase L1-like esterase
MTKRIGSSPFVYTDDGAKALSVANPDGSNSDLAVNFTSVSAIPSGFVGTARVGTDLYVGDGVTLNLSDSSGRTAYIGVVASRCGAMDQYYSGNWYMDGATVHVATEGLTKLKVIHPNWSVQGLADTGSGGTLTLSATIDYINTAGVQILTPITYSGATTTVITNGNNSNPDWMVVDIPKGRTFRIRYHGVWTVGMCATGSNYIPIYASGTLFEGQNNGNGVDVANQLTSASPTYAVGSIVFRPVAILGNTNRATVLICGDSIAVGTKDAEDYALKCGVLERSIPFGVINIARGGELAQVVTSTPANISKRIALAQYCTHVIVNYGTNDLASGYTAVQVQGFLNTFYTQNFVGKSYIVCTLLPKTTGTWDTAAAQTVTVYDAQLLALNDIILTGTITGQSGTIDLHEIFSDAYATNKWKVYGTTATAITSDGIHPNHKGNVYGASKINIGQLI